MNEFDQYRHLNKNRESKVIVELDYDMAAEIVVKQSFGLHRMVCALVRARERAEVIEDGWLKSDLAAALREAATKYRM
ncbi:MAG: hypothetical protein GY757_19110 [bacterium]|nr:hypothetical protein [bacterium]